MTDKEKETETITQEDVNKAAREAVRIEFFCESCAWKNDCDLCGGENTAFDCCECPADSFEDGFKAGANFALAKQEKDADTVIQGWVARDCDGDVFLYQNKPDRHEIYWNGIMMLSLPIDSFPDLTWKSDPLPVEITIKRKKSESLTGSEPKPAEPKFKVGDKVRIVSDIHHNNKYIGEVTEVVYVDDDPILPYEVDLCNDVKVGCWFGESDLEPYAEQTENYVQVDYHGADTAASTIADGCQPVTDCHDFNHIVNRGFRDHNRLHIAAQIVAALYANHQAAKGFKSMEELVHKALDITDTIIKESEKGGEA